MNYDNCFKVLIIFLYVSFHSACIFATDEVDIVEKHAVDTMLDPDIVDNQTVDVASNIAATLVAMPAPDPLPPYLSLIRPEPGIIMTLAEFERVISIEEHILFEAVEASPRAAQLAGYRSSICLHLDTESLVGPGDEFVTDEDIIPRIEIQVGERILYKRINTDYLVFIDIAPRRIYFSATPPPTAGIYFHPGF